ncbi:dihydroorotate dehydrogenase electron transfer subunit [Candidatus Peregrinibacteria bacterium CG10_big_fil_rev_8_21_14_0_10_42_8]|nr:MAG: dihydroorotate dehydrogenase electron transfer subunit [Candidatus Peregrinibacteria bacterium CG10_big_fil_rev_8_21_14_0_10_42_8]
MTKLEKPLVLEIKKIADEAESTKTFIFEHNLEAKPGQFIMLWIPRVDEKPISISFQDGKKFGITVMKVGEFTKKLFSLKEGDKVGIRGPYGNSFNIEGENLVLVGGGCGCGPMGFLADTAKKAGKNVNFIIGAKNKKYLMFEKRMKNSGVNTFVTTDDGSYGMKGYSTDLLKEMLEKNNISKVYSCGPEVMLKKVAELCREFGIPSEISMERYMKCGYGLCGQCCIDGTGDRVCMEGPVFSGEKMLKSEEFGKYKREKSGRRVNF